MFGVSNIKITLEAPGAGVWLFLAVACLAIGLAIFFYREVADTVERSLLLWLALLRIGAIAVVLLIMFQPVLSFEKRGGEKPLLLVCVDNSRSMSISDVEHRPNRFQSVRNLLAGDKGIYGDLAEEYMIELFAVGAEAKRLDGPAGLFSCEADGQSTALADTVAAAVAQSAAPARILLFSDGVDNSGTDAVQGLAALGVPIDCVGAGSALVAENRFADIAISDILTPKRAAVNELAEISVFVRSSGFGGEIVEVSLLQEEKGDGGKVKESREIARQPFRLDDRRGDQEVRLQFTPVKMGTQAYRVRVDVKPGEKIRENNESEFLLQVTEPQIKVLYADIPRGESKYLGRLLSGDPHIRALSLIKTGPGRFMQKGDVAGLKLDSFPDSREVLDRFDVFIIGSLDARHVPPAACRALAERIERNAGLLMLAGEGAFGSGGWAESPLASLIPVRMGGGDRVEAAKFQMVLTPAGRTHPALSGIAEFFGGAGAQPKETLEPMEIFNVTAGAARTADTLAVHPSAKCPDGTEMPILVVASVGKGRVAALTGGPTWPWLTVQSGAGRRTPYHRFWGQMIRWLASEKSKSDGTAGGPFSAWCDKAHYRPGERVNFYARVRDSEGQAARDAVVSATVKGPAGTSGVLTLVPQDDSLGEYEAVYSPPSAGAYEAVVSASAGGKALGEIGIKFAVGRTNLEFEKFDLDDRLLRRIAEATGGTYVPLSEAPKLIEGLRDRERERRKRVELRLFNLPFFFLIFVGLVTVEWVLRRRNELL